MMQVSRSVGWCGCRRRQGVKSSQVECLGQTCLATERQGITNAGPFLAVGTVVEVRNTSPVRCATAGCV